MLVLALAIDVVREREGRAAAERHMRQAYAQTRRLSRPSAVEMVAERIVSDVSRSLNADRVSLALYRAGDDVLAIEATSVSPASGILETHIQPGAWVAGHVFATGRPLFVRDVRQLGAAAAPAGRYRTSSFAAVPLLSGRQPLGVLTVTDKTDGTALTGDDFARLRTYASLAAIGIVAARSHREADRLAHAATIDSLTGLVNRSYLEARLHQEVERAKRGDSPPGILIADVDDFKMINDTHGHQTGDAVLRAVGRVLRSAVRVFDVCARYGGDEFAILMLNGDRASAAACGERIRRRIASYHSAPNGAADLPPFTMSIGIALLEPGDTPSDLISRADRFLYQAKAEGKNRVRMHRGLPHQGSPFKMTGDEQEPM
jgi:diguanylate cyclase (GGDEF)-like protein